MKINLIRDGAAQKSSLSLSKKRIQWTQAAMNRFTICSSHLGYFFPLSTYPKQLSFYEKYIAQQICNARDLSMFEKADLPFECIGWEQVLDRITMQKGILCTYHFGAYQLINYLLEREKIPFALLVGDQVYKEWEIRNKGLQNILKLAEEESRFQLLNAKDRSSLRKMYELNAEGFLLLVYIDGLEGVSNSNRQNLETITFLGKEIEVPKGVAQLAYSLRIPVSTLIAKRDSNRVVLYSGPTFLVDEKEDKKTFVSRCMQGAYAFLASFVVAHPEQWMNWPHLHILRKDLYSGTRGLINNYGAISFDPKKMGLYFDRRGCPRVWSKSDFQPLDVSPLVLKNLYRTWFLGRYG